MQYAREFLAAIVGCELTGIIESVFTAPAIQSWYATLAKPAFTPPSWLFAPVWTLLYALMGVSLWLVWKEKAKKGAKQIAYAAFALQLALNVLWSIAFFGLHSPQLGFAVIVLLWLAIGATISLFSRFSSSAAWLLVPYWAWTTFAAALNYAVWQLN
ncbi:hypothetical protein AUJ14_01610 [Candidatus Micrarchaeota archaeon CG1_02_55_22]|nr:MAG: hypothetical protein AUJ14_01610 [Candidatus Micrarchaeota archaeon CG1_02_55_22]